MPVLVTLRVAGHVWNLRSSRCYRAVKRAFLKSRGRFGLRLIEFAVMGNHLHLIVEADSNEALSQGMQGLGIRIAKALNRVMGRRGRVFDDHYHSRLLRTPAELVNAIAYVLGNAEHHYGNPRTDPFSSAGERELLAAPAGWLCGKGWRRARQIPHWMRNAPGAAPAD
jgi:REP element-mobilizing transposase RayT